jgi:putative phage-type endonuclease
MKYRHLMIIGMPMETSMETLIETPMESVETSMEPMETLIETPMESMEPVETPMEPMETPIETPMESMEPIETPRKRKRHSQILQQRVTLLKKRPQFKQRSEEWFLQRQTRITASEAASCLLKTERVCSSYISTFGSCMKLTGKSLNTYCSLEDYIIRKCSDFHKIGNTTFKDTPATLWGKMYEDVASKLYANLKKTDIYEFGLLNHPRLKWLAASPDGITKEGVMIEIKCPKSRKIKESEPPIHYWVQTQIQLEVCNLDVCDFLECEIKEVTFPEFMNTPIEKSPGLLLAIGDNEYLYPPLHINTHQEYIAWMEEFKTASMYPVFYYIDKYNINSIKRDKEWFDTVKEDFKAVYKTISFFQKDKQAFLDHLEAIKKEKSQGFLEKFESTVCEL